MDKQGEKTMSERDISQSSEEQESEEMDSKGGKSSFGSDTSDPKKHYSGVEMKQGEVLQDSDWNEEESNVISSSKGDRTMTERDNLGSEELEGRGQETKEARELNDATLEPSARVEEAGSYKESEAIETSVTEMVDAGSSEAGENVISKIDSFTKETEEGYVKSESGEEIYAKIKGKEPGELPLESKEDEILLDGKGGDKPIDPEAVEGEVIRFKHISEAESPSEMPPELSEDEIGQKWPGKEGGADVEYKFFHEGETPSEMPPELSEDVISLKEELGKPIPAEEDPTAEVGKISGPNPKSEDEKERGER
jgi:hypothetical protein